MPQSGGFAFGAFRLDARARRFLRDEVEIPLKPLQFTLLHLLVSRAGDLVTKDDLMKAGWGGRIVSEDSVIQAVSRLRAASGADGLGRCIETVARHGYRFNPHLAPDPAPGPAVDAEALAAPHRAFMNGQAGLKTLRVPAIARALETFESSCVSTRATRCITWGMPTPAFSWPSRHARAARPTRNGGSAPSSSQRRQRRTCHRRRAARDPGRCEQPDSPAIVAAWWLKGLLCLDRGAIDEALGYFSKEPALEPIGHLYARECCAQVWYAIGACRIERGEVDEARVAFAEALTRVPGHPMVRAALERLAGSDAGCLDASESGHFDPLKAQRFEEVMAHAARLLHAGRTPAAVHLLSKALAAAPPGNAGWWIPLDPLLGVAARARRVGAGAPAPDGAGHDERALAARGESAAAFDGRCIRRMLRCSSLEYGQYSHSSRLASRAPRPSPCRADFHHGR